MCLQVITPRDMSAPQWVSPEQANRRRRVKGVDGTIINLRCNIWQHFPTGLVPEMSDYQI